MTPFVQRFLQHLLDRGGAARLDANLGSALWPRPGSRQPRRRQALGRLVGAWARRLEERGLVEVRGWPSRVNITEAGRMALAQGMLAATQEERDD